MEEEKLFNLEKLDKLKESLANRLTKKDFMSSFERVLKIVQQIQQAQSMAIHKLESAVSAIMKKLSNDHEVSLAELKKGVSEGFIGKELKGLMNRHEQAMSNMEDRVSKLKD